MEQANSHVVVIEAYTAQYGDPIAFRAGEAVHVQRADPDFPEWFWCRGPDCKEGWVHFSYLSQTIGQATAVRDQHLRPGLDFENVALLCARLPKYLLSPR